MARQNNMLPKGAAPHSRTPHASHDPSAPAQGYGSGYPQQYDTPEHGDQTPMPGASRDIFSTLRPDPPSLNSRFEPFAPPAGRPQGGYARPAYGEPEGQPYAAHGHDGHGHDPYGRPLPGSYPAQGGYASDPAQEHDPRYYAQPQQGYAPQSGYGQDPAYGYDDPYRPNAADPYATSREGAQGYDADGGYYEDEYADAPESGARRGPRAAVVVGALLGAIALGGGLAYGYKAMTNGSRDGGKLPILRADSAPAKAQPADAGGKQIPHTDKKLVNRLTEDRSPARPVPVSILPPTPDRDAADGPRRVPTLVVNRDGTIAPPASSSNSPPQVGSGVPGLLIDGLTPRTPPQAREVAPPPPPARALSVEAPPNAPPRRVASVPPVTAIEAPAAALPAPRAEVGSRRPVPTRQAARTPTSAAPAPAVSAPGAVPSSGYVAVLVSRQSNMDALKSLADIQQKYPGVLQGRAADVREANLGEKGVWYRVVVGPPASRQTANTVGGELKSKGYGGCWVTGY
jgi:hypothetical protein